MEEEVIVGVPPCRSGGWRRGIVAEAVIEREDDGDEGEGQESDQPGREKREAAEECASFGVDSVPWVSVSQQLPGGAGLP